MDAGEAGTGLRGGSRVAEVVALAPAVEPGGARELTPDELAFHRWMLDHALRPGDDWSSFDRADQYSLRSLRYQLNFIQWPWPSPATRARRPSPATPTRLSAT